MLGVCLDSQHAGSLSAAQWSVIPADRHRLPITRSTLPTHHPSLQLEEAVELFMFAGRPRQALRILAQRLSDAVEGAAADASRGEAWAGPE